MSAKNPVAGPMQGRLPFEGAPVPVEPFHPDWASRMTMSGLINAVSGVISPDEGLVTEHGLALIDPDTLLSGLVMDPRGEQARAAENVYDGIAFSPDRYLKLVVSPERLASSVQNRTRRARQLQPNQDAAQAAVMRAGGHVLEEHIDAMERVQGDLGSEYQSLKAIYRDLQGRRRGHVRYRAENLYSHLRISEAAVLSSVETAGITLKWTAEEKVLARDALRYQLWGWRGQGNRRLDNWSDLVTVAGKHNVAQDAKFKQSIWQTRQKLRQFEPYLQDAS